MDIKTSQRYKKKKKKKQKKHLYLLNLDYRHVGGGGGLVTKSCLTLTTPWTVACQSPLSMGLSRQEYRSGLPFSV